MRHAKPKFPLSMGRKWLIIQGIDPIVTEAYWVHYARQETFRRSKARCCIGVGAVAIWQVSSPI